MKMDLDQFPKDKWITIVSVQRSGTHALSDYFRSQLNFLHKENLGEPLNLNTPNNNSANICFERAICTIMMDQIEDEISMPISNYVMYQRIIEKSFTVKLKRNWFDVVASHVIAQSDNIWLDNKCKDYDFYMKNISRSFFSENMNYTINHLKKLDSYKTDLTLHYEQIYPLLNPTYTNLKKQKVDSRVYDLLRKWYDEDLPAALYSPL